MSMPPAPENNDLEIAQLNLAAQERQRAEERAAEQALKEELAQLRSGAATAARGSASDYYASQGLDPDQYANSINSTINQILAGIAPSDPNPGSYFTDIGPQIYNKDETAYQNRQQRILDTIFAPNFASKRVPFTLDDPYLAGIEAEQFSNADDIIRNMLERGVLTTAGYGAAKENLEGQRPGVRSRLNEVGTGQIASGQQGLRDVANEARQAASALRLGSPFDPYSYSSDADQVFNDFINNLGSNIRAALPGNLFSTAGLAALGGAAQGAGNTAFNPAAAAGIIEQDDEEKDRTSATNPF